jgi:TctA family transporter
VNFIYPTIEHLSQLRLLQIILFSLTGSMTGIILSCLPGVDRFAALTILFFLQVIIGFPPDLFVLFAIAGCIPVLFAAEQETAWFAAGSDTKRRSLKVLATGVLSLALLKSEIATFIIESKSVGMIHFIVIALLSHIIFSRQSSGNFGKPLIAVVLGMLTAYVSTSLNTKSLDFPRELVGLTEGIDLLIVFAGICIFAPILSKKQQKIQSYTQDGNVIGSLLQITGILAVFFFGIGTTATSILLFSIFHYESVAFGALISLEYPTKTTETVIAILLSAAITFFMRKKFHSLFAGTPLWIVQAMMTLISVSAIIISGLGVTSVYLALILGLIGVALDKSQIPKILFFLGFIYGQYLEYLINISALTHQSFFQTPLVP